MKQYSVKNKCFRDHRKTRCINPRCGKWVELYREKNCPDAVCPLCGSKQRAIVELCSLRPETWQRFPICCMRRSPLSVCQSVESNAKAFRRIIHIACSLPGGETG